MLPRMEEGTRAHLRTGAEAFDRGEYFAAHEAWEDAWRLEQGDARTILQGLIQLAAAFHKLAGGNVNGALRLWRRGAERLRGAEEWEGLRVGRLREDVLRRLAAGGQIAGPPPRLLR